MNKQFILGAVLLSALLANPLVQAATIVPAQKSEWRYFYRYDVYYGVNQCFSDESSAVSAILDLYASTPNSCPAIFTGWNTSWPNTEGRTEWFQRCPPVSGVPYIWGQQHMEQRQFKYKQGSFWSGCELPPSDSFDNVDRHFFYFCADSDNYELFQPPYNYPDPQVPACRLKAGKPDPDKQPRSNDCCNIGNPINIATGKKYQREVDYVGAGAFPVKFERHYSGAAWSHTYDRNVTLNSITSAYDVVYVNRPDGQRLTFWLDDTTYRSDPDITAKLQRLSSGGLPSGWRYTDVDDSIEIYNVDGRLLSISNRAGLTLTLAYDLSGRPATVSDDHGRQLSFGYDPAGRLSTMTDPAGGLFQYAYDAAGNLATATYPDTRVRTYLYNESAYTSGTNLPFALTGIIDENNQRFATFRYDALGRATQSEHAGGAERVIVSYVSDESRAVTDAAGATRTIGLILNNRIFRVSAVTGGACTNCGLAASYSYESNTGNVSGRTDFRGISSSHSYSSTWGDPRNLEVQRTEAAGTSNYRTTTTSWHATFRLPAQITESLRRTNFAHDIAGNILTRTVTDLTVTPNVSRTWTYTYNGFGQVLTADGPRTDVSDGTTYTYYSCSTGFQCGQVETITNALGHVTTYNTHNAHGQPLTVTDPNGLVTTLTYDARQRLMSREVGGETTAFEYWPTGLLKKVTLPDASFLLYTYDNAHRLTQISDAENNRIVYTLDAMGNRTKEESFDPSDALVRLHHRAFNTLNQLWKDIGAANTAAVTTTFGYDANGNQTSANAPLGRNSSNLYDEHNRLKQITDPASGITLFGYDPNDHLTSVTDPRGKVTSYVYSGFGDLKQQTSPDTGVTDQVYDSGGNLSTATDARGKTGTYSHDALNRLTQLSYPDQTITYTFDTGTNNKGRLMQVTDNSGNTSWTYSSLGRVASRTQVMSGVSKTVGYGYNSAGQLTTLTTPSGQTITYGYSNSRIASITVNGTTLLNSVLYDPFGPARQWTWGNSTLAVRTFDQDGNVDQIDSAGLRTYSQDDAFRITGITDAVNANLSWTHGYDLLDRLTSATRTGQSQTWTYDANGNRLTEGGTSSSTFTISSTNNRLSSVSGAISRTYGYDAAGNTTSYGGFTFTYNDAGRMTGVSGSATASYSLNALGQRVKKTASGMSTYFVFDEAGHLIGEYDGSGTLIQETVWMEDTPVATLRPDGGSVSIFYVHADHLNTPRRISRPSDNAILWRWDSDPFGTDAANEDPDADTNLFKFGLRFPGQYFDAETGLSYNYFRDYDPAIGRYVESDPFSWSQLLSIYREAGQKAALDPAAMRLSSFDALRQITNARLQEDLREGGFWDAYTYARNSPVTLIDPTGEQAFGGPGGIGGWPQRCEDSACEKECTKQYDKDSEKCRKVKIRRLRALCWAGAMAKYGVCLAAC